jgi:hypothetical protein
LLPVEGTKKREIQWQYALNSLVDRLMDQDGLPTLLALHNLGGRIELSCVIPGLELVRGNQQVAEFDFAFISDHEVSGGESKSGTELGQKDLERAHLAAEVGMQKFYFCTTRLFSDQTLASIESLRNELKPKGLEVVTLMASDLLGSKNIQQK